MISFKATFHLWILSLKSLKMDIFKVGSTIKPYEICKALSSDVESFWLWGFKIEQKMILDNKYKEIKANKLFY